MNLRKTASAATLLVAALALAGCDTMGSSQRLQTAAAPEAAMPVQSSTVSSGSLPPLAGAASAEQVAPGLTGTPVLGGASTQTTATAGVGTSLPAVGAPAGVTVGTRNLSGGLTVEKLLGGWNVAGGGTQCRLNLTQTAKDNTGRLRASAPACQIAGLAVVASWALVGNGVQLYDEAGSIIAVLQLSGDRFIGTVAGGTAIVMTA